jgi:trimeric autotransporter adhesin
MATLNAVNATGPIRFDTFNIASLLAGPTLTNTPTTFTRGADADNATSFIGTGFTYAGGLFTGGTINSISSVASGQTQFTIGGLSLSVAQFRGFASAGNSQGFLAAVFAGDDTLTGSAFADHLRGYAGNDMLLNNPGSNDADTLDGGTGADSMEGGDGDDLYIVDNTADSILDSSGFDTVKSSAASYDLAGGAERLILTGKGDLNGGGDKLPNQIFGTIGANLLTGRDGNDLLDGGAGNDSLDGGGQNDTLLGGAGVDTMAAGAGDDLFIVDNVKDALSDSSGNDSVQSTISYILAADLEHLFLTGTGALSGTGNASANQIAGSTGANKLLGLGGDDTLDGGDGNDTLDGGTGNDTMRGGAGNDTYFIEGANDEVVESAGKAGGIDIVFSTGDINLDANVENLTLIGSKGGLFVSGNDLNNVIMAKNDNLGLAKNQLNGGNGNDTIIGSAGRDELSGGAGADSLIGGGGNDTYTVDDATDKVVETLSQSKAGGDDRVFYQGSIGYTLGNNVENLALQNSSGATFGTGNSLDNAIAGNNSANTLDGRAGADVLIGFDGDDVYVVDNALDKVDESFITVNPGIDTVRSSIDFDLTANGSTVLGDVEHLILLGKASIGTGNGLDNSILGNAGKNLLSGLIGNDTLDGGAGADTLQGNDGNDLYIIDNKLDVVQENGTGAADQISSSKISVDISVAALAGIENIVLSGKAALNATGNGAGNFITGNDSANKLVGLSGNDTLVGAAGNDTLIGGDGVDVLRGGSGNDTYLVDASDLAGGGDFELGGHGIDTIISSSNISIFGTAALEGIENLTLAAGSAAIQGFGNLLANVITGNDLANNLFGNNGDDTIDGGVGNDGIDGGFDNDSLTGGAGNDGIGGGPGSDTIDGGVGDDTVRGGADDDVIIVSSGNDTVVYSLGEGGDLIKGFDGNPVGGQDVLNLDEVFDTIPVDTADRASHVLILDHGATVDVLVNADKNLANGYELTVATIQTKDAVTIGEDVLLGTL